MFDFDETKTIITKAHYADDIFTIEIPDFAITINDGTDKNYVFQDFINKDFELSFAENSKLTKIGDYAFYYCKGLQSINFTNAINLLEIGRFSFYNCEQIQTLTFPKSLTSFSGYGAFRKCTNLKKVTFQDNCDLKNLSSGTFAYTQITSFRVPSKCIVLYGECFGECPINVFTVEEGNDIFEVYQNSLFTKGYETLISHARNISLSIPEQTIAIGDLVLYGYTFSMICPKQITNFTKWSFLGFKGKSLTICSPIQNIGGQMFGETDFLVELTFLDKIDSIADNAFQACKSLKRVFFLYPVTNIGSNPFYSTDSICFYGAVQSIRNLLTPQKISKCYIGFYITCNSKPKHHNLSLFTYIFINSYID